MPRNTVDWSAVDEPTDPEKFDPAVDIYADIIGKELARIENNLADAQSPGSLSVKVLVTMGAEQGKIEDFTRHVAMQRFLHGHGVLESYFAAYCEIGNSTHVKSGEAFSFPVKDGEGKRGDRFSMLLFTAHERQTLRYMKRS